MSDYFDDDDLTEGDELDAGGFADAFDAAYRSELRLAPEPEPSAEDVTQDVASAPAPVLSPEEPPARPQVSLEDRLIAAARGTISMPQEPTRAGYSQEALEQIARHDPERYAELREQGHTLQPIRWGPDRDR